MWYCNKSNKNNHYNEQVDCHPLPGRQAPTSPTRPLPTTKYLTNQTRAKGDSKEKNMTPCIDIHLCYYRCLLLFSCFCLYLCVFTLFPNSRTPDCAAQGMYSA